jgi:uncharacterized membrane protein
MSLVEWLKPFVEYAGFLAAYAAWALAALATTRYEIAMACIVLVVTGVLVSLPSPKLS